MAIMNPYNYKKPIGLNNKVETPQVMANNSVVKTKSDMYLEQKIMSARPEELTYLLYEGLVKFINQAMIFNEQRLFEKSHNSNLRAQAIIQELRSSLNMDIPMSEQFESLYLFMIDLLVDANISKSNDKLNDALGLAQDLKDTWKEAMNL